MKSVKDIMSTDVVFCSKEDSLYDAAVKMKERNVGVIPLCTEKNELVGVVTDRDLVLRGYAEKKDSTATIQEVMSEQLHSIAPDTSVQEASGLMADHQIRRLPVVDDGKLVGMLSLGDLSLEDMSNDAAGHALEEISERPEVH
ncbi:CBS domain-containing protein [Virgibacillus byunsanensis]|uniref:CBS domain-containing protein n=1 Tax=Virgibacillus byunsanensis TaxID=570945 RepID=A0ABW3LNB8_9BACI